MAVTNFSPLLGLALPTTGDLSGTWGATVNDAITSLIDSAVAGTTTLSADADVTLSTTNGASNQARNAVILWTASNGATTRNITAPAQSKAYIVINAGTGSIVIRGSGPTTGVTVPSGIKALVAWNGSDFVSVAKSLINLTSDVTGTLPIANGGTGTTATTFTNLATNVTGVLPLLNGGTGVTTPALVAGTNVTITGTWPNQTINSSGGGGGGGTVTAVSASAPLASSGGTSPNISLTGTVPVANGGTGTATPSLVAGSNVSVTGSWPNQTVAVTGSGAVLNVTAFQASTPFLVPAGVTSLLCEVIGGGGGSAATSNTAAGGGGYAYGIIAVTPLETLTITVGAKGIGFQPSPGQGTAGGTSSIVRGATTLMSATGGGGSGTSNPTGAGGGGSGATVYNTSGGNGYYTSSTQQLFVFPGASGRGFPASLQQQNGPGGGGFSTGNGGDGVAGQITIQYVS
jgi:hypothetical protein